MRILSALLSIVITVAFFTSCTSRTNADFSESSIQSIAPQNSEVSTESMQPSSSAQEPILSLLAELKIPGEIMVYKI